MKTILRITLLFVTVLTVAVTSAMAQRVIKGTVYMDGEPGAGITVEVHKGGKMMTSFDGVYEVEADAKSKWIKFTFLDESKKLEIEGKAGDVFDFAFTGSIPSGDDANGAVGGEVNLKTSEELLRERNKEFMNELTLYTQFQKQGDFKSALPHWKVLYDRYPKSTLNIYIHGGRMFEDRIEKAATDAEKDKIIDNYMKMFDRRIKHFGKEGYVLGRKGTAWLEYKLHESRSERPEGDELKNIYKTGYEWLGKSIEMQGAETEPPILVLYMQTSIALFKLGELPKETVVLNYEKCTELGNSIVSESADAKQVEQTRDVVLPYIEEIFGKSGAADCDALISIFTPQFEQNQDDIEFITSMLRRLRRAKCDESALYEKATERQYELDPSAEAAFNMARRYLKLDDTEKAKEYYKQAMEQETDQELLANYYYEYGIFVFAKDGALQEARSYARKAIAINPDYCEAYELIGDIYVAASQKFDGDEFEKAAIFWLAVDYFNKARKGDCAVDAAEKASRYKKYYPKKEEAFMRSIQEGSSYKIEGWINETTKARF